MAQCDFLDWKYRDCHTCCDLSSFGCYLTTACVDAKNLADDCRELTILRKFKMVNYLEAKYM